MDPLSLGALIGRLQADTADSKRKLRGIEPRLAAVEQAIFSFTKWGSRGLLLVALWAGALMVNLDPEQKAELVILLLKQLTRS